MAPKIYKEYPWVHFFPEENKTGCATCTATKVLTYPEIFEHGIQNLIAKFAEEHKNCPNSKTE